MYSSFNLLFRVEFNDISLILVSEVDTVSQLVLSVSMVLFNTLYSYLDITL